MDLIKHAILFLPTTEYMGTDLCSHTIFILASIQLRLRLLLNTGNFSLTPIAFSQPLQQLSLL